jgi:CMP-N,N'-diacetyllegionaminic acid synthase
MILGAICARGGSKGIPQKNLKKLDGLELIHYTIADAMDCKLLDKIIVSTDSQEIADEVSKYGFANIQMRPAELATDNASKWDVFRYIAERNPGYDILVDLDIGCPLRDVSDIDVCVEKLKSGYDVVVTAYESERNPYFNMVQEWFETEDGRRTQVRIVGDFMEESETYTCRQQAPTVYSLSPSVFAIRTDALFKYSHWSRSNLGIVEIPRKRGIDIDTQDDFDYVEYLMRKND